MRILPNRSHLADDSLQKTQELNIFFGAAAVFIELRQYDRALYTFNRILNDSPGQSRAYWGLVICQSDRFTRINTMESDKSGSLMDYPNSNSHMDNYTFNKNYQEKKK